MVRLGQKSAPTHGAGDEKRVPQSITRAALSKRVHKPLNGRVSGTSRESEPSERTEPWKLVKNVLLLPATDEGNRVALDQAVFAKHRVLL